MTAASRSLATALWGARFASGLLPSGYTTIWDTTDRDRPKKVSVKSPSEGSRPLANLSGN